MIGIGRFRFTAFAGDSVVFEFSPVLLYIYVLFSSVFVFVFASEEDSRDGMPILNRLECDECIDTCGIELRDELRDDRDRDPNPNPVENVVTSHPKLPAWSCRCRCRCRTLTLEPKLLNRIMIYLSREDNSATCRKVAGLRFYHSFITDHKIATEDPRTCNVVCCELSKTGCSTRKW